MIPAVQRVWRRSALPPAQQALRAHERHHHNQSQLQRMGQRVRRCQDDDGLAGPANPSLSHPRNRERQLPVQEQLGTSTQDREGKGKNLDQHHRPEPYLKAGQISVEMPGHVWMPPFMQGSLRTIWTCDRVRSCIRPFVAARIRPLAGMELRGPGANQFYELVAH